MRQLKPHRVMNSLEKEEGHRGEKRVCFHENEDWS